MPFTTPKFPAIFEEKLITNVKAVVERDMKLALDHFYPADNLDDFKERTLGQFIGVNFPALAIEPVGNPVRQDDDDRRLDEELRVQLFLGVLDKDAESVTIKIMRYVRALDAVLRSATKSDYVAGFAANKIGAFRLELTHDYGPTGKSKQPNVYFRPASLELTFNFMELQ